MEAKQLARIVGRWGPVLACMAVIFTASAQPKAVVPDFGVFDWSLKKAGHLLIYAALALAWQHGLADGGRPTVRQAAMALVLAGLYGASDEYHQLFVAGRGAAIVDVGIDVLGAALGLLAAWAARTALGSQRRVDNRGVSPPRGE